jgi:hypothetical protein
VPEEQLHMEDLDAKEDLSYQEYPVKIFLTEYEDQDVQGAMESPYRGRSYMGKGGRVEGRVSKFLFQSV